MNRHTNISGLKRAFLELFGGPEDELRVFSAPGRVNLIGEHTDYNGGYVLPAALSLSSTVIARPRADRRIRFASTGLGITADACLDRLEACNRLPWGSYQLGAAHMLLRAGYPLTGCELLYHETVPYGAGLSSSAAIEVATAYALTTLGKETAGISGEIDRIALAGLCRLAENEYIGVGCGIMDQFASAMGRDGHAVLLNCKSLAYRYVPLRLGGYRLLISNTNKKRSLAGSRYNQRREECRLGLEILKRSIPGADCLGDITYEQFLEYGGAIESGDVRKRVGHVVAEDERVLKSARALENGDLEGFGRLMTASHRSLRDLYEVTGPELDALVEEAARIDGVLGTRMTGAGFGGCTVSIVREDAVERFISAVGSNYAGRTGLNASFYLPEIGCGVREVKQHES